MEPYNEIIDKLLNIMNTPSKGGKILQVEPHPQLQGLGVTREESKEIVNFLVEKDLIELIKPGSYTITPYGMKICKDGGYVQYLKIQEDLFDIRNTLTNN